MWKVELDTILSKREEMGKNIKAIVEKETEVWGIEIIDVKIKDIQPGEYETNDGQSGRGRTFKKS
jgi:regulator of protease activity HflC (stomatin/prohibitin superfamily)